jgi:hypothetical protein
MNSPDGVQDRLSKFLLQNANVIRNSNLIFLDEAESRLLDPKALRFVGSHS